MTFPSWKYDIDRLLGENEKLRTEIERQTERADQAHAHSEAFREENEWLRAALRKIADETNCERGPWCREIARRALEPKP